MSIIVTQSLSNALIERFLEVHKAHRPIELLLVLASLVHQLIFVI